jgi:DNA-binding NarL/FixJ family response regulator
LILAGKSNKEVALIRKRSVRTIEDHRKRIMDKLGVHNLLGLIRAAAAMGLFRIER